MSQSSPVKWDKEKIVKALLDRQAQGLELNIGAIQKQHNSLSAAIYGHFPSHDAALLAAGIDPESARKAVRWGPARVVAALCEYCRSPSDC